MRHQLILGIDPSSTIIGFAAMVSPDRIEQAGLLKPKAHDPVLVRSRMLTDELVCLVNEMAPELVVFEIPSGKVGARHKGSGAGLAVYGMAVGMMYQAVYSVMEGGSVLAVDENTWTGGREKRKRRRELAMAYPEYAQRAKNDKGGDVADAIGLVLWYFQQERIARLTPAGD